MKTIRKSSKLDKVCYDIRGPALKEAERLEEEGYEVLKLNIGNPAPFGFSMPSEISRDIIRNFHRADGYGPSNGIFPARKAVMQETQRLGIEGVRLEDIYIGNGVSELIEMSLKGLLNNGDEILIPMPDYPLWTAAASLAGGVPVHYYCDEQADWQPDVEDIRKKISSRTKALVVINPNNPTGSVYSEENLEALVRLAREHGLLLLSDEIYDKILYEDAVHVPLARLAGDHLCLTFNGLSKSYRAAGLRGGWMFVSGNKKPARDYIEGLDILSNMRLCSNVPAQLGIQTALGGFQSIRTLVGETGSLRLRRDACYEGLIGIPGISCVKPKGALYCFPRLDVRKFKIKDDLRFILDFLHEHHILMVQGSGFNWPEPDHFRVVFLPDRRILTKALNLLKKFLDGYEQSGEKESIRS